MRPLIKCPGGKQRLVESILLHMPVSCNTYYEPFLGGAAVFLRVWKERRAKKYVLSDNNADFMNFYGVIRDDALKFITSFRRMCTKYNSAKFCDKKEMYLCVRSAFNVARGASLLCCADKSARRRRAVQFFFLNKTSFNGLFRVNSDHKFNVPFGDRKEINIDAEAVHVIEGALLDPAVFLLHSDYRMVCAGAATDDVVYFDPPYFSDVGGFHKYSPGGFLQGDHEILRVVCGNLKRRGARVLLSNSDAPFVRKLYQGFKFNIVSQWRSVGGGAATRKKINDLLIV